jgi:ankyrin repeat protein
LREFLALLKENLDCNAQDLEGKTAVHYAIINNRSDILEKLIDTFGNELNMNIKDKSG